MEIDFRWYWFIYSGNKKGIIFSQLKSKAVKKSKFSEKSRLKY